MTGMTDSPEAATQSGGRSVLARFVLVLVGLSAIGFVVSLIGNLAGWQGFDDGGESTAAGSTFWFMYFFGGVGALVAGVVALVRSRRRAGPERAAGRTALIYVVATIAIIVFVDTVIG